jgi:hypothetical protein
MKPTNKVVRRNKKLIGLARDGQEFLAKECVDFAIFRRDDLQLSASLFISSSVVEDFGSVKRIHAS